MNTGNIVLGRFRKCCTGVAMGAMLAHSGEAVLNENKPFESNYNEISSKEESLITDQWIILNDLDDIEK